MGFNWFVIIAHVLVLSIVNSANTLTLQLPSLLSVLNFNPVFSLFQKSLAPFLLHANSPTGFIIIGDMLVMFNNWNDKCVFTFQFHLPDLLRKAGLRVIEGK